MHAFTYWPSFALRLRMALTCWGLLWLSCAAPLAAGDGPARLVKDISPTQDAHPSDFSYPRLFTASGNYLYFIAYEYGRVPGLFRTDGTATGTVLVRELLGRTATALCDAGGTLYLMLSVDDHNAELWKSDGTTSGTVPIFAGNLEGLGALGSQVFFSASSPESGFEPWVSDGTSSGTHQLKDIYKGTIGSIPGTFHTVGDKLYFTVCYGTYGNELWVTDGTTTNTQRFLTAAPFSHSITYDCLPLNDRGFCFLPNGSVVYAAADSNSYCQALEVSNGQPNGTRTLKYFTGSIALGPNSLIGAGSWVWFAADDGVHGTELWRTDGTSQGTVMIRDINPSGDSIYHLDAIPFNNGLLFAANDHTHGYELWFSDGTTSGTRLVRDLVEGASDSFSNPPMPDGSAAFTLRGNQALFVAADSLWRTDGTAEGTIKLTNVLVEKGIMTWADKTYFQGYDGVTGLEPWCSDGTATGTTLLKDVNNVSSSGAPTSLFAAGKQLFFSGWSKATGAEFWTSDGTPSGTRLLCDLEPGPRSSSPHQWQKMGSSTFFLTSDPNSNTVDAWQTDKLAKETRRLAQYWGTPAVRLSHCDFPLPFRGGTLFAATDMAHGTELWRSDGTPQSARLVLDLNPGTNRGYPANLTVLGDRVLFTAEDGVHGRQLWRSDGTASGTAMVLNLTPETGKPEIKFFGVTGDLLLFVAKSYEHGSDLWATDGTAEGTHVLQRINTDETKFQAPPVNYQGAVLFVDGYTLALWRSDGTASGTTKLKQIVDDPYMMKVCCYTEYEGFLYFFVRPAKAPWVLWRTDGTSAGTMPVFTMPPNCSGLDPASLNLCAFDGLLYFPCYSAQQGMELWCSDGTAVGTTPVFDLNPGPAGSFPLNLTVMNGALYFTANDGVHGRALWRLQGWQAAPELIKDFPYYLESNPLGDFMDLAGNLVFFKYNGVIFHDEPELWRSDGSAAGTLPLTFTGPAATSPVVSMEGGKVMLGGKLYFSGQVDGKGGLWSLGDPLNSPPSLIKECDRWALPGNLVVNGQIFEFTLYVNSTRTEMWGSDGTPAGTRFMTVLPPGAYDQNAPHAVTAGGLLFFSARKSGQLTLWRSDGTSSGTIPLRADSVTVATGVDRAGFTAAGNRLFFIGWIAGSGTQLLVSDGTSSGTVLTRALHPGPVDSNAWLNPWTGSWLTTMGERAWFVADDGIHGRELWVSDGTETGTRLVRDVNPDGDANPANLTPCGGAIYFCADDGQHGRELWRTDGTPAGTTLMADINPVGDGNPQSMVAANGRLYFVANDVMHGAELWRTDGTSARTVMVQDIAPGPASSVPANLTVSGDNLYFGADDNTATGAELWTLPLDQPGAGVKDWALYR